MLYNCFYTVAELRLTQLEECLENLIPGICKLPLVANLVIGRALVYRINYIPTLLEVFGKINNGFANVIYLLSADGIRF